MNMPTMRQVLLLIYICHVQFLPTLAMFSWLFGSSAGITNDGGGGKVKSVNNEIASELAQIPFELESVDEKFLAEAEKFTDVKMSLLDTCQHKVVLGLKKSCVLMSEEELAKLSVNLLNCQSAVEGRSIFPCTSGMTLKECTQHMDKDTWNAYHIISNRARAVCYSARQLQFRAKTELSINKLVSSAEQQLLAMASLQVEQEKLGHLTDNTLKTITGGHEALLQQQQHLKNAQQNLQFYVASNLRELTREKALIASGQKELSEMTERIKDKLDEAHGQLAMNEEGRKKNHQEIISDLTDMQQKARQAWEKIENSTQNIMKQHRETLLHYQDALRNLQRVNDSICYLLQLVERTRSDIDSKLNWLTELAGGTDNQLAIILTTTLHLGYFLFGAIGAAFVGAPPITRMALLVAVPLNALSEIRKGHSLDLLSLSVLILATAPMHWIAKAVCCAIQRSHDCNASRLHVTSRNGMPPKKESVNYPPFGNSDSSYGQSQMENEKQLRREGDDDRNRAATTPRRVAYSSIIVTSVKKIVNTLSKSTVCVTNGEKGGVEASNVFSSDSLTESESPSSEDASSSRNRISVQRPATPNSVQNTDAAASTATVSPDLDENPRSIELGKHQSSTTPPNGDFGRDVSASFAGSKIGQSQLDTIKNKWWKYTQTNLPGGEQEGPTLSY